MQNKFGSIKKEEGHVKFTQLIIKTIDIQRHNGCQDYSTILLSSPFVVLLIVSSPWDTFFNGS